MCRTVRERTGSTEASVPTKENVGLFPAMGAVHVGEVAVSDVLQAAGDAGGAVLLHVGDVDDLGQLVRDQAYEVGAGIFFAEEVYLNIGPGVIA